MRQRRNRDLDSALFQDVVWGVQHDAFEDKLGKSLLQAWSLGASDEPVASMIYDRVHPLRVREKFGELTPFRKPRLQAGDVLVGYDTDGDCIRLPLQTLASGMLITGNTGSGKSILLSRLALSVAAKGCAIWIWEMYKSDQRRLRSPLQLLGSNLVILRPGLWKYNLLQADPRDPRAHLAMAVDLQIRNFGLPPRARTILRQAGHELYRKFHIWEGQKDHWPCLFDEFEWVRSTPKLNSAAREAILDRLGSYLTTLTPQCGAYRLGWDPVDLAHYSIVFEMRGAAEYDKSLRLQSFLFALFQYELERGACNAPLSLWTCLEDSQRATQTCSAIAGGELAPIDELAGVTRGTGRGLCFTAQTMNGISRGLIPNLSTKIVGRLGSHEDYHGACSDLGMQPSQIEWAKRRLTPGKFILQCADGHWREPCIVHVPLLKFPPPVNDDEAAESTRALDALPTTFADEFADWQLYPVIRGPIPATSASPTAPHSTTQETIPSARPSLPTLADVREYRFCKAVADRPLRPSSEYAGLIRISSKTAVPLRRNLVAKGLLRERRVDSGNGRGRILLEVTPAGVAALAAYDSQEANR